MQNELQVVFKKIMKMTWEDILNEFGCGARLGGGFKHDANHISTDVSPSRCFSSCTNQKRGLSGVWWEGWDSDRRHDDSYLCLQQERGQGKCDVLRNVTTRLVAILDVHLPQFSEPQVHECPDTCVTTATCWERLLIAGSHGFNLIACKASALPVPEGHI